MPSQYIYHFGKCTFAYKANALESNPREWITHNFGVSEMTLDRALQLCSQPIEQRRDHRVKVDRYALKHVLKDREEKLIANAKEIGELKSQVTKLEGDFNSKSEALSDAKKEIVKLKEQLAATETGK